MNRARLSVVVIARNEEPRIRRCLESVAWADELIVVDGASTDRTAELARACGARVIVHPFEGSFAQERNLGMEAASGDWVLQIDADDLATPAFRDAVGQMLAAPGPHQAYKFHRKSILLGRVMRHGGWYHYLPNLVRRDVRYEGLVHERPALTGTIGRLEADVEHHPCGDLATFVARHNRYTGLSAQELFQRHGRMEAAALRRQLLRRPWKTFWKTYVKKQGFREGMHGLVLSVFYAFVELLKWAKYWERCWVPPEASAIPAGEGAPSGSAAVRRRTLSVGLMTKNEEGRLAACLDGVAGWAEEIVIIDDCSTDRTVEIARRYTDKVFEYASEQNHDRQWNRGIGHASAEWILHIDADERVTPALRQAIDRALADPGDCGAFELMRKNIFLGRPMRHGGWYHRHQVLFRREGARCTGRGIHVKLEVAGPVRRLDAELEHYPFSSLSQFVDRQNGYTSVEARVMWEAQGPRRAKEVARHLTFRPIKLFWKSYVKQQGRREEMHGLVFGLLYAFMHALLWAKYWEHLMAKEAACRGA